MSKLFEPSSSLASWWKPNGSVATGVPLGVSNDAVELRFRTFDKPEIATIDLGEASCPFPVERYKDWIYLPNGSDEWWKPLQLDVNFYNPLEVDGLHRKFAGLKNDPNAIREFCQSFGFLGVNTWFIYLEFDPEYLDEVYVVGECLTDWYQQIGLARSIIGLYDSLKTGDQAEISKLIHASKYEVYFPEDVTYYNRKAFSSLALSSEPLEISPNLSIQDAGKELLVQTVSKILQKTSSPWLTLKTSPQLRLVPTSLIGAIYLLLADEILGKVSPYRRCAVCQTKFIPVKSQGKYCSSRCKQKAYRQRGSKANGN